MMRTRWDMDRYKLPYSSILGRRDPLWIPAARVRKRLFPCCPAGEPARASRRATEFDETNPNPIFGRLEDARCSRTLPDGSDASCGANAISRLKYKFLGFFWLQRAATHRGGFRGTMRRRDVGCVAGKHARVAVAVGSHGFRIARRGL